MPIYLIVTPAGSVVAAYQRMHLAQVHARTIVGSSIITVDLLDELPDAVRDDLMTEIWDDDSETPVETPTIRKPRKL
jgi:hypothetical protein